MNAPILALDWIYIGTAQTLALAIMNVGDYDFSAATVGVSTDGSQFQDTSALLEKTTTMGYKPVFPVYMGSEWLVPEGQKLYVNVLVGSESVQSEYTVHQAFPNTMIKAKAMTATLSASNVQMFENIFDLPIVTTAPTDGSSCWLSSDPPAIGTQGVGVSQADIPVGPIVLPSTETRDTINLYWQTSLFSIGSGSMPPALPQISNEKVYIRFEIDNDMDNVEAVLQLLDEPNDQFCYVFLYRSGNVASSISTFTSFNNGLLPYTFMLISDEEVSISSLTITNPVCIRIDDYSSFWTSQGLSTDAEIKEYLDGLTYEEIQNGVTIGGDEPSGGLTYPENLLADLLIKTSMSGSDEIDGDYIVKIDGSIINDYNVGSSPNYIFSDNSDGVYFIGPSGSYDYSTIGALIFYSENQTVINCIANDKFYIRVDGLSSSIEKAILLVALATDNDGANLYIYLTNDNNVSSTVCKLSDNSDNQYAYVNSAYFIPTHIEGEEYNYPETLTAENLILVDITANQDYFTAQGLATDEEIRAHLDSIPYSSFGQPATPIDPEPIGEDKYLDGIGLGFLWEEMKDYIESQLSASGTILPIPLSSYELSDDKLSATIMLDITYTGYDSVTVRYKKGSEPTETDPEVNQSTGVQVDDVGTYYIRAFGGSYTPSPSYKLKVTGLAIPKPQLSYAKFEYIGSPGYLVLLDNYADYEGKDYSCTCTIVNSEGTSSQDYNFLIGETEEGETCGFVYEISDGMLSVPSQNGRPLNRDSLLASLLKSSYTFQVTVKLGSLSVTSDVLTVPAYVIPPTEWTAISDMKFGTSIISSICYGNGRFVAGGYDGKGAYSSNGTTWTAISDMKFGTSSIYSVCYGNGKFVAVGTDGKGAYSEDGINWTAISDMKFGTSSINSVCYGNGKFIAVGRSKKGSYSEDGINWTAISDIANSDSLNSICYGNGKFVAGGHDGKGAYCIA